MNRAYKMKKEYLQIQKIEGPLIVLNGIEDASYGETVKIKINDNDLRTNKM